MARNKTKKKYTSIGGQALMEGIMMRGPEKAVMCVRRMDGSITSEEVAVKKPTIWNKIPIIRGLVSFVQSMSMGTKMLMRSADLAIEDEENAAKAEAAAEEAANAAEVAEAAEAAEETAETGSSEAAHTVQTAEAEAPAARIEAPAAAEKSKKQIKAEKRSAKKEKKDSGSDLGFLSVIATVLGFGLAIVLFFYLPTWAYNGLLYILPENAEQYLRDTPVWKSVIEGFMKIFIFLFYMILISGMKEIKRLFQYHGAEHKTIFCYEAGEELTVENVRKYKRFHPRCGTSFIILMLLVGIAAGICITAFLPRQFDENVWIRPLIKLLLLPLTMGVGYELLKFAGKHDNVLTRIISAPGLWMQRISTREPDDDQIECAIAAIKPVIPENGEDMQ